MYGYATDETEELMPLTIILAHKLNKKMADGRRDGTLPWVRPDSKSQVGSLLMMCAVLWPYYQEMMCVVLLGENQGCSIVHRPVGQCFDGGEKGLD